MDVAPQAVAGAAGKPSHAHEPEGKPGHAQSFLALTALGVVFGDIGTSPLYTFSTTLAAADNPPC
jgi:KUP system potassium uptake protein